VAETRSASRNFCVTTLGLYTKFIKAKREYKCGKIQVSPYLPDTMERERGADGYVVDVGIIKLLRRN
jgi:hypothetical protein